MDKNVQSSAVHNFQHGSYIYLMLPIEKIIEIGPIKHNNSSIKNISKLALCYVNFNQVKAESIENHTEYKPTLFSIDLY